MDRKMVQQEKHYRKIEEIYNCKRLNTWEDVW